MSARGWSAFREVAGGIWPLMLLAGCGDAPRGDGEGTWSYTIRKGFSRRTELYRRAFHHCG